MKLMRFFSDLFQVSASVLAAAIGLTFALIGLLMIVALELYTPRLLDYPLRAVTAAFSISIGVAALGVSCGVRRDFGKDE